MSLVIGVDPGGTTGLAAVEDTPERGYRLRFHFAPQGDGALIVRQVEAIVVRELGRDLISPWWIAAERFVVNRRAGRSGTAAAGQRARDILGALEAAFPGRVKLRNASVMKAWATDARIRRAGLWPAQGRPHTRDAVGHALYFQVTSLGNPDPLGSAFELAELERGRG